MKCCKCNADATIGAYCENHCPRVNGTRPQPSSDPATYTGAMRMAMEQGIMAVPFRSEEDAFEGWLLSSASWTFGEYLAIRIGLR